MRSFPPRDVSPLLSEFHRNPSGQVEIDHGEQPESGRHRYSPLRVPGTTPGRCQTLPAAQPFPIWWLSTPTISGQYVRHIRNPLQAIVRSSRIKMEASEASQVPEDYVNKPRFHKSADHGVPGLTRYRSDDIIVVARFESRITTSENIPGL
ncbi:hypothetical protein ACRALDRAFT_2040565 [Sodiomyces alcalophilus JCM 7366]|uniref:uncharacterized protein n=1 Tax=Sodiomyces alcalophilus JCM 7366 TaxID=591952 RepID=UPI0039B6D526